MRGSDFIAQNANLGWDEGRGSARLQDAVLDAVAQGAFVMPETIWINVNAPDGRVVSFAVSEDYFRLGEPGDSVRMSMDGLTAQKVADQLDFMLPTPRMVDLIYNAATTKPDPRPQGDGKGGPPPGQVNMPLLAKHNAVVDQQLASVGYTDGIIAGHKKDVVLTNRLGEREICFKKGVAVPQAYCVSPASKQVAIYGWNKNPKGAKACHGGTLPGSCPIQPESLVHGNNYGDYSHGIRMVHPEAMVDGQIVPLVNVLSSPDLGPVLNWGAPLTVLRHPAVEPVQGLVGKGGTTLPRPRAASPIVQQPTLASVGGLSTGSKFLWVALGSAAGWLGVQYGLPYLKRWMR